MAWKATARNVDGIQFETLRKQIDGKFNDIHDELTDCYREGKPFRTFGVLTKEQFEKLHGLIFHLRDIEFHAENLKQPAKDQIPEEKYNDITDRDGNVIGKKDEQAAGKITQLSTEGIELTI